VIKTLKPQKPAYASRGKSQKCSEEVSGSEGKGKDGGQGLCRRLGAKNNVRIGSGRSQGYARSSEEPAKLERGGGEISLFWDTTQGRLLFQNRLENKGTHLLKKETNVSLDEEHGKTKADQKPVEITIRGLRQTFVKAP